MSKISKNRLQSDDLTSGLTPEPNRGYQEMAEDEFFVVEEDWDDEEDGEALDSEEWASLADLDLALDRADEEASHAEDEDFDFTPDAFEGVTSNPEAPAAGQEAGAPERSFMDELAEDLETGAHEGSVVAPDQADLENPVDPVDAFDPVDMAETADHADGADEEDPHHYSTLWSTPLPEGSDGGADAEASAMAPVFEEELGDNVIAEAEIGFADGAELDHQPVPGEDGEEVWAGAEAPYEGEASDAFAEPYSQTDFTDETVAFDASPSALDPVEASEDTYDQEDWADDSVSLEAPTEPTPAQESFDAEPPRLLRRSKKSAQEETQSQDFFSDILEADDLGSMDEDEAERLLEEEARFDDPDLNPLTEREASAEEHDAPDAAELHPQGPVAGDAPAGLTRFQGAGQPHSTAAAIDVEISEQPFYNPEQAHYELPDEALASQITTDRPVPRISIQAFCDDPKNGVIIQKAAEDRRLAKAHVTVHMGGMKGAIEYFRDTPTPNLIFIEMPLDAGDVFARLEELAQVCDPGTKVVLIGRINDVMLYRALMRNGVSEYLVPPLSVPQVIDTISALYIDPEAPPIGRCISFMGSKGGTGSSVLAHNIAWIIAEDLFEDVTLVDFDLHFGTTGLDFNQEPQQGVADALTTPERLDDQLLERLLLRCSDRLSLFAAPGSLERTFDIDAESYEAVIDVVRASVPVVIVDLPSSWEMWSRRILSFSEEIVITATPDLASLRNTKNMVDLLKAARPNDADPKLVINQVGIPKRPEIPVKDFGEAVGLEPALVLPFDPQLFGAAANNGQMLSQLKPDARASAGLKHLAQSLSSRDAQESEKSNVVDMFKSLLKRK